MKATFTSMWGTYPNPTLQGSAEKTRGIIRGQHLPHNTFVLSLSCWNLKSIPWKCCWNPALASLGCTATKTSICTHYVTMQSAWYPWWPPWQRLSREHFQMLRHTHMVQMEEGCTLGGWSTVPSTHYATHPDGSSGNCGCFQRQHGKFSSNSNLSETFVVVIRFPPTSKYGRVCAALRTTSYSHSPVRLVDWWSTAANCRLLSF